MESSENILFTKLDEFIRKYYVNRIIKGTLLSVIFIGLYIFSFSGIEYLSYLSVLARTVIFYFSVIFLLSIVLYFIAIPLLQLMKIGKVLDYKHASIIISKHFPTIQDKLLNTLELVELKHNTQNDLIIASINQRIEAFKGIQFVLAISKSKIALYSRIVAVITFVFGLLLWFAPTVITEGSARIINYNTVFEKPMPFKIDLLNNNLIVEKGSDIQISISITGDYIPQNPEICIGNTSYFLEKKEQNNYIYTIKGVNNSFSFFFKADEYSSRKYDLTVVSPPQIQSFTLNATVPEYTGEKNISQNNIGDITVPEGTMLKWTINSSDASSFYFVFSDSSKHFLEQSGSIYSGSYKTKKNVSYTIVSSNQKIKNKSLIKYYITVIPDLFPSISIENNKDSVSLFQSVVKGLIKDDYGFSKLQFVYHTLSKKDSIVSVPVPISLNTTSQEFSFYIDFSLFPAGEKVSYYFVVYDNDKVNGAKSTKSTIFDFSIPTKSEIEKMDSKLSKSMENDMEKSMKKAQDLKKELLQAQKKLLNQNLSNWEKSQLLQNIQEKQNNLLQEIESIQNKNSLKNELNQFSQQDESILEKQKAIEELLQSLLDDNLKKMLDEFNELSKKLSNEQFFKKSEDMKMDLEDVEKQLDRNLEMLKRMDIEKGLNNTLNDIKELKKNQDDLLQNIDKNNNQENANKQDNLKDDLQKLQEKYKDLLEKNSELDKKMNLDDLNKEFNDSKNAMEQTSQELKQNNKNKSKKQMEKASEQLDKLEKYMQNTINKNQKQEQEEDESQLRQILDNLLTLSFEQETIENAISNISNSDPRFITLLNNQIAIAESFNIIKDSLYSLAKRQVSINKTITDEVKDIQRSFRKIKTAFDDRNVSQVKVNQRFVMTHLNNLALLFAEILNNMQNQSQQQSGNPSQCKNPKNKGKGKPSMTEMKSQQQSFKQQLQKMIDQMKQGEKGKGMSQQLGKMLSQQEKFQQMLQNSLKNGGFSPDASKKLQEIKNMVEQNQKDIINQNFTPELMMRQNQILTRLLEAENAENTREKDEKRESKSALDKPDSNKNAIIKYNNQNKTYKEYIQYDNVKMNTFFKGKYDMYLLKISK